MKLTFSKNEVRKLLLYKQLLLNPREISGHEGIKTVFERLRSLQYDPQNPCGRSIDISLQARVQGTNPSDYHKWLYEDRKGIETYDKELCVIPVDDLPLRGGRFSPARQKKLNEFIREYRAKLDKLLRNIRRNGPVCSYDIFGDEKVDFFWEPSRWSKVALDSLWKTGELVIVCRKKGRKFFDVPEKVYGDKYTWREHSEENHVRKEQLKRRITSVGLLPRSGTGSGWLGLGPGKEIVPILDRSIQDEEVSEINVTGLDFSYVIVSRDIELLKRMDRLSFKKRVSFLSPLDNLLWDRQLIRDIFDFDYKWEAYTPKKLRKYGHYVLPILYGINFIGRIELKYNHRSERLEVRGLWFEKNHEWNKENCIAFFNYLEEFRRYINAKDVEWFCEKPTTRSKSSST